MESNPSPKMSKKTLERIESRTLNKLRQSLSRSPSQVAQLTNTLNRNSLSKTVLVFESDKEVPSQKNLISLTDKHDPLAQREADLLVDRHKKRLSQINTMNIQWGNKNSIMPNTPGQHHDLLAVRNEH